VLDQSTDTERVESRHFHWNEYHRRAPDWHVIVPRSAISQGNQPSAASAGPDERGSAPRGVSVLEAAAAAIDCQEDRSIGRRSQPACHGDRARPDERIAPPGRAQCVEDPAGFGRDHGSATPACSEPTCAVPVQHLARGERIRLGASRSRRESNSVRNNSPLSPVR
jgi:hypothetical protein